MREARSRTFVPSPGRSRASLLPRPPPAPPTLAVFAARRRWAAFVLGGSLAVLAVELLPWIFPHFAGAVSLSQARRAAGFVPFAFALAGGAAVVTCVLR